MTATYTFSRGETISLSLNVTSGSTIDVSAISADLRKFQSSTLTPNTPITKQFTITTRAASGDVPAGWTLTITAADSRNIGAGLYQVDAHVTVATGEYITTPLLIQIKEPATP